jgi:hypothetical protein
MKAESFTRSTNTMPLFDSLDRRTVTRNCSAAGSFALCSISQDRETPKHRSPGLGNRTRPAVFDDATSPGRAQPVSIARVPNLEFAVVVMTFVKALTRL